MLLKTVIKFQKALALAAAASNRHEAEAAERAARRVMEACNIDPVELPNVSFYNHMNFADNPVLKKLRDEWRAAHPYYWYGKTGKDGGARRLRRKPRSKPAAKPEPVVNFDGLFDDFAQSIAAKCDPVNTKPKPSSDR